VENHGNAGRLRAVAIVALLLISSVPWAVAAATATLPQTPIREVKEEHFGTEVSDPYRWLEDTKNPEVVAWLGLSPQQIVKWLEPGETGDDEDEATRSRWAMGGA